MVYLLQTYENLVSIVPSGSLSYNTLYKITINTGMSGYLPETGAYDTLDEDYTFWFTSTYCPLFTTVNRVRLEAGPVADSLIDDTIYRMIYKNSMDAVDIYNLAKSQTNTYTTWGCGPNDIPFLFRRYVECKTAYDILALMESVNGNNVDQLKTLGDLTIKYGGTGGGSGPKSDPSKKKQLLDCWTEILNSLNGIRTAVRGYYDESKMYAHPVREPYHNRVVRPILTNNVNPVGPWENGYDWQTYRTYWGR